MKSSEAEPLSLEELTTLQSLFQRWVLRSHPWQNGSSEESDAIQTYYSLQSDVKEGGMERDEEEEQKNIARYGEQELD